MSAITIPQQTAEGLREAADLIAAHPDLPLAYVTTSTLSGDVNLSWYLHGNTAAAVQKETARRIVTGIGGTWDKQGSDFTGWFTFTQSHGALSLFVSVTREAVCERVVVGTETVQVPAQPAQPATEASTEEREVVQWRCEPLLAEPHGAETDLLAAVRSARGTS